MRVRPRTYLVLAVLLAQVFSLYILFRLVAAIESLTTVLSLR